MRLLVCFLSGVGLISAQTITPYTLTEVSRSFDLQGNVKSESRFLFAALENGSIVAVDLNPSGMGNRQIIDTVNERLLLVDPSSRSASEMLYKWSGRAVSEPCGRRFHLIIGATVSVDESPMVVAGVPAQHISVSSPNRPAMDLLVAPSLGCRVLETTTLLNGKRLKTQTSENVKLGSPDPTLFEVPSDYKLSRTPIP